MVRLRKAVKGDWARLYWYRNDAETRARFTSHQFVTLEDHMAWLDETLVDKNLLLFLADDQEMGGAVGTVRLGVLKRGKQRWGDCSITVEPLARGKGYGRELVAGLIFQGQVAGLDGLIAKIMPDNYASLRAFAGQGFLPVSYAADVVHLERRL